MFEIFFYKGTLNIPLLFEIVLRLKQVQMKGDLILHIINIVDTLMFKVGINGQ